MGFRQKVCKYSIGLTASFEVYLLICDIAQASTSLQHRVVLNDIPALEPFVPSVNETVAVEEAATSIATSVVRVVDSSSIVVSVDGPVDLVCLLLNVTLPCIC